MNDSVKTLIIFWSIFSASSFINSNTWHLICNNFNLNFIYGIVCLYVCVCAFSLHRESPDMILWDKPLIFEVVPSLVVKHDWRRRPTLGDGRRSRLKLTLQEHRSSSPPQVIIGSGARRASGSKVGKGHSQWNVAEGLRSKMNGSTPCCLYYWGKAKAAVRGPRLR
jgi:hypothetical protein